MTHCIFCQDIQPENILAQSPHFFAVLDIDPIQEGHLLLISKEHYMNLREIPSAVLLDLLELEKKMIALLEDEFDVLGVSVIQNNGKVMDVGTHFHTHIVPRYTDDQFWEHQKVLPTKIDLNQLIKKLALL